MSIHFDEKGKFFTDIVTKEKVLVRIRTTSHHIVGYVHVRPDERLKDAMNKSEMFIAITDAVVYDPTSDAPLHTNFLCLHRDHIVWIAPHNEIKAEEG